MIVRQPGDGTMVLVNQTDHAKLSGIFAAHWGNARFARPAARQSMVQAACFHDNGWHRYEAAPLYDVQERCSPSFFQVPNTDEQLNEFGAAIDWLTEIDAYAGLLISRHRTGLYRNRYNAVTQPVSVSRVRNDPRLDAFVARYEALQQRQLESFDKARFARDYRLLQFWDLLSLSLCVREPREEIFEPVPMTMDSDDGVAMKMKPLGDGRISLDPYPFDAPGVVGGYVYRQLPLSFPDESAFRFAWFGAEPRMARFVFVPG